MHRAVARRVRQASTHHLLASMRPSSSRSVAAGGWPRSGACASSSTSADREPKIAHECRRTCNESNLKATTMRQRTAYGRHNAVLKFWCTVKPKAESSRPLLM